MFTDGADDGARYLASADRGQGTIGGKASYTVEVAGGNLVRASYGWGAGTTVTYGFRSTDAGGMPPGTFGFSRFTGLQILATELALQSWSDVANITFERVGTTTGETAFTNDATMLFANYASGMEGSSAFAVLPGVRAGPAPTGDAWFRSTLDYNMAPELTNRGRHVLVHEIGHAIGLSHAGDYNGSDGDPSYAASAEYYQDSRQYTVMSYWSETNTGADFHDRRSAAPLLDDIAAIQFLYGANMSTRTGDTTYGFNANAGRDFYSVTLQSQPVVFAVWDAGGYDTLDFSGYTANQVIDLRQGAFSSVGGLTGNVAIARGVVVERAVGGSGDDILYAQAAPTPVQLPDIAKPQTTANTSTETAIWLDGAFDLAFEANVPLSTALPHATVNAVSSGGREYYAFTVSQAGATGLFDVDGTTGADVFLRLYDASGQLLASEDDFAYDPGSAVVQDPFLIHTFAAAGTYYLVLERFETTPSDGAALPAGTAYTLHVSISSAATNGALTGSQLEGGFGADELIGGLGSDILYGQLSNDILRDGGGSEGVRDFLFGGGGNDTYYVTSSLTGPLDLVYEGGTNPDVMGFVTDVDTIVSQGSFFWDYYSVAEVMRIDNAAGGQIVGGQNNQAIHGGAGSDLISVYGGSNIVDAGAGTDAVSFSLYDLAESFDGINTLVMKPGSGLDYVYGFESGVDRIDLTAFNFGITGAQVLAQAVNVDQAGTDNDYVYFYLTSAGGVDNFVAFIGLLSTQLQAADFTTV